MISRKQALEELDLDTHPDRESLREQVKGLGEKRRTRILHAAIKGHLDDEARRPFEAELRKLQRDLQADGRKLILLFEGRDAAGKGGLISQVSRTLNPTHVRVVALSKPSPREQAEPYMDRYLAQLPGPGEITFFDRSWYNRAMVEPVMGFCTDEEHEAFMSQVGTYEERMVSDGTTTLIKMYFSVSRPKQGKRLAQRGKDAWRLSDVDRQAQEQWDAYTEKKQALLQRTHTDQHPWWVIRSDRKKLAKLEVMKLILRQVPYSGRSRTLDFTAHPDLCVPGDFELRQMVTQLENEGEE